MNKNKLRSNIKKIEGRTGVDYNSILILFFLESILKRIAVSQYKDHFIFKGGFLLSSLLGIKNRTTMDMDMLFVNQQFTEENIIRVIKNIVEIEIKDGISHILERTEPIRDEEKYGGFRVNIKCMLENIKQIVPLDIVTGDPVTPSAINYQYKSLNENKLINIKTYNLETIIAEKIHTIFVRGNFNSRNKDFFDLFIILKMRREQINPKVLKMAFKNTFAYRETEFDVTEIRKILNSISEDMSMKSRWQNFIKKNPYAQGIQLSDTINACFNILKL